LNCSGAALTDLQPKCCQLALRERFPGKVVVVSSFGAESAVLRHLAATVDPAAPVLVVDTRRHFVETLAYRDGLAAHLGLWEIRGSFAKSPIALIVAMGDRGS
jgi:3'-phosphoadenosine 5'-phosphosulfate sulfotransferase (PAPS reductase)/FAD synthetase